MGAFRLPDGLYHPPPVIWIDFNILSKYSSVKLNLVSARFRGYNPCVLAVWRAALEVHFYAKLIHTLHQTVDIVRHNLWLKTSLTCASGSLLRTKPPNLLLIMWKAVSTLLLR